MLRKIIAFHCLIAIALLLINCNNSAERKKTSATDTIEINNNTDQGEGSLDDVRKQQINLLITESKRTMDSIDLAYKYIRRLSPMLNLNAAERQQVNESLMELNAAKELVILETQQTVIDQLKEKTSSLNNIMDNMKTKSDKLQSISSTLSRVSVMLEKTTNILSSALTSGLIRPRLSTVPEAL
jgi:hypothetical protein